MDFVVICSSIKFMILNLTWFSQCFCNSWSCLMLINIWTPIQFRRVLLLKLWPLWITWTGEFRLINDFSNLTKSFLVLLFNKWCSWSEMSFLWVFTVGKRPIPVICCKSELLQSEIMESGAETAVKKRTIYPPIEPYNTGTLKVSGIHTIYWEQSGNPDGHVR